MTIKTVRNLRRISQILFLAFFLYLLLQTELKSSFETGIMEENIRIPYPVKIFFEFDPLVAVNTVLSTHMLYKGLIFSIILIGLTMILGRFFCGWICPLGTLNHFFSYYKSPHRGKKRLIRNRFKKWQTLKYYILFGMLVTSFFTTLQIGLLDPLSFTFRSIGLSILPAFRYVLGLGLDYLYATEISSLQRLSDLGYFLFGSNLLNYTGHLYHIGMVLGVIFIVFMFFNQYITRFWCRAICPLGALLGIFAKLSLLGLEKNKDICTHCNLCLLHCQGADEPIPGEKWRQHECHLCLNCQAVCPEPGALKFKFFPNNAEDIRAISPDLTRRRIVTSVAAGAVFLPIMRATDGLNVNYNPKLIRPPGSVEEKEFLKRCIRCGECMKVCPTNAIHPTLFEAGLEGVWTPYLIMRIGYCEQNCVLCSQVCPTGAIWQIDEEEKLGKKNGKPVKIGLASIDTGRCLPYARDIQCIVCEEHCPTSPKAISLKEIEVTDRNGNKVKLQQPHVDPKLCWGCGICETVCPVRDNPAIYITNLGETRDPNRQLLLEDM